MASLLFVTPLLVVYELGILVLGPEAVRNGADVWLRELLGWLGFGEYFLLPVLTVAILLSWHYTTRKPWRLSAGILSGMVIECVLLACFLRLILQLQGVLFEAVAGLWGQVETQASVAVEASGAIPRTVGFLGAGVYEELLFRLMLLPVAGWTFRRLGMDSQRSLILAVIVTSLVFAAAHYVGDYGETVAWESGLFWFSFVFRFLAGVFFSMLFVCRGFGIAAGSHAGYDVLVGSF
jgi:hypothetical protein